ncbi:hypothetical protein Taro_021129 [Colocasia esculenta]|uniref:Uncharacterized protein n=1 Tax=Colocasia esculenta TaxID=4460 RepID=A0A843UY56_COLES|nr:hypothetical protein [Colocasia esculenta]
MYIHRHQLHRQELQSHRLYIHNQGLHKQEGYTHLVLYQMPPTSLSMQPSVLRLLGVHLQLLQQDYMTLPPEKKEAIFRDLQQHFNFLQSPAKDADILRHMGEMQRKQRSHLKRKDNHLRMHVIICHQVMILVNGGTCVRYGIEKIQVIERNKSNRSHLSMPYRRGRTNIHQLSNDFMEREGRHPTRPKMFQMTQARTTPDGSVMWSNEQSRQMTDQMTQLMNPTPLEESDATANPPVLTPEEAFRQVFGRDRPGRIRCGGRGQTLRSWYVSSECGSSSNTVYQRLLEEQSQQKSEISQQKSEIKRMKKIIEDQEQRIAAQSTDIDVRVEAQVEARLAELKTQMLQSMDDRLQEVIRIRMSGSGALTVLPEDETEGEEGDEEDEGTFGEVE